MKKTYEEVFDAMIENDAHHFHTLTDYRRFAILAMEEYRSKISAEFPSDVSYYVCEDINYFNELKVISLPFESWNDADSFRSTMKDGHLYKNKSLVIISIHPIASPLLASKDARIRELEEELARRKIKCDCDENTCCYYCEFEKTGMRNLTPKP